MSQNLYENIQDVPVWVKHMDEAAGNIFLAGFLINRVKDIPLGFISSLLAGVAIASFACAYSLQCITSCYYDHHPDYVFDYRLGFQLQSLCGAIASFMLIINPQLWLPCLALFVLANGFWYLSEQFRQKHPTNYPPMPSNPHHYLLYTQWSFIAITCSTMMGLIGYCNSQAFSSCIQIGMFLNYAAVVQAFYYLFQPDSPSIPLVSDVQ